ncbi:MAG: replication-relaxation family protein [Solirubrobacteraceae bacterium]
MTRRYVSAAVHREQVAQLVERDLAIIRWVSDLRFVTGSQLTRLCFADTDDPVVNGRSARRALLRLVRLGLLERLPRQVGGVRSGSAGFIYHLGLSGQRLAHERGWQPERRRRRSLTPGTLFVRHALNVSELHTLLVESDRSRRFELLELVSEPTCWRSFSGTSGQRQTLKPDSYVSLGIGPYEDSYFIEVDMGTEGSLALERQLRLYIAYFESGAEQAERSVFPRVLWLMPDDRRVTAIADSVQRLRAGDRELFQVARFDQPLTVLCRASV